jgi:predicted outer membrane repeat protein
MDEYTKEIHFGGKQLVIWGNNATLDAKQKGRFFSSAVGPNDDDDDEHENTSLEMHDLVMQNGKALQGGAIYALSGVELKIFTSTFTSNSATSGGGAIFTGEDSDGSLIIQDSTFERNQAQQDYGGAIYINSDALTIRDSTFERNEAFGGKGGAIYAYDNSFVRIEGSQFIKGTDPSAPHNDIAQTGSNSTVEFLCPKGTTGTPFKMQKDELSVLELPPTKQVVNCK